MSAYMRFEGALDFADGAAATAAVERMASSEWREESQVQAGDFRVTGAQVRVATDASAPSEAWFSTLSFLGELAEAATEGHIRCEYDAGEGEVERRRVLAGGEDVPDELPALGSERDRKRPWWKIW